MVDFFEEKVVSDNEKEMGLRLRQVREALKKSQKEVSAAAHLGQSYLSAIETGKKRITIGLLNYYSERYLVSMDWIFRGTGEMFCSKPKPLTLNLLPDESGVFRSEKPTDPASMGSLFEALQASVSEVENLKNEVWRLGERVRFLEKKEAGERVERDDSGG